MRERHSVHLCHLLACQVTSLLAGLLTSLLVYLLVWTDNLPQFLSSIMLNEPDSCIRCNIFMVVDGSIIMYLLVVVIQACIIIALVYSKVRVISFMSSHVGVNFAAHFLCVWATSSLLLKFIIHGWGEPARTSVWSVKHFHTPIQLYILL